MGTITLTNPIASTEVTAGLHATNYSNLQTLLNGNIDNANIKAGAAIDVSKLAAGTAGQVLTTTGGVPVWAAPVSALTTAENAIGADVIIVNAATFYDGPSVSLAAGTWLLVGRVQVAETANVLTNLTAKLWDGTTAYCSGEAVNISVGAIKNNGISLQAIVTPGSTTTYKISVAATNGASGTRILAAVPENGAGNNTSKLTAIKIA